MTARQSFSFEGLAWLEGLAKHLRVLAGEFAVVLEKAKEGIELRKRHYPALRARLNELSYQGWFLSFFFGLSELDQLSVQCPSLTPIQLGERVAEMYRSSFEEHGQAIIECHPERAFAIRPAMDAHKRGEHALSVPIFFAQADGILAAKFGKSLFHGREDMTIQSLAQTLLDKAQAQNGEVTSVNDWVWLMAGLRWEGLREKPPIAFNPGERAIHGYEGLNRNTVLHGEALEEYATEINSLKAFSLLSCVSSLPNQREAHPASSVSLDEDH